MRKYKEVFNMSGNDERDLKCLLRIFKIFLDEPLFVQETDEIIFGQQFRYVKHLQKSYQHNIDLKQEALREMLQISSRMNKNQHVYNKVCMYVLAQGIKAQDNLGVLTHAAENDNLELLKLLIEKEPSLKFEFAQAIPNVINSGEYTNRVMNFMLDEVGISEEAPFQNSVLTWMSTRGDLNLLKLVEKRQWEFKSVVRPIFTAAAHYADNSDKHLKFCLHMMQNPVWYQKFKKHIHKHPDFYPEPILQLSKNLQEKEKLNQYVKIKFFWKQIKDVFVLKNSKNKNHQAETNSINTPPKINKKIL